MSKHAGWNWGLAAFLVVAGNAVGGEHPDRDDDGHLIRVPRDQPTIQAAVDAASDGDRIVVTGGRVCGATLNKRLELVGRRGATIVGCDAPAVGAFRVGFFLPDGSASG